MNRQLFVKRLIYFFSGMPLVSVSNFLFIFYFRSDNEFSIFFQIAVVNNILKVSTYSLGFEK